VPNLKEALRPKDEGLSCFRAESRIKSQESRQKDSWFLILDSWFLTLTVHVQALNNPWTNSIS